MSPSDKIIWVVTGVYLAAVASLTLQPQSTVYPGGAVLWVTQLLARLPVTAWMGTSVVEFGANVVMFVPFGVLFCLLLGGRRWWLVLVSAFAATVLIETAQRFIPNRVSDPRDLVANTVGAAIGLLATLVVRRLVRASRTPHQSRPSMAQWIEQVRSHPGDIRDIDAVAAVHADRDERESGH